MQKLRSTLLAVLAWSAVGSATAEDGLVFEDAWIRAMPPGMKMTAGFGKLSNTGSEPLALVACASPAFGAVSLHRSELADGISRMREVKSLALGPGESVELAPGGYHLMLMMPASEIQPGDDVEIEMSSADGRRFRFRLPVLRR
jgi:copper(I)-binding protein